MRPFINYGMGATSLGGGGVKHIWTPCVGSTIFCLTSLRGGQFVFRHLAELLAGNGVSLNKCMLLVVQQFVGHFGVIKDILAHLGGGGGGSKRFHAPR